MKGGIRDWVANGGLEKTPAPPRPAADPLKQRLAAARESLPKHDPFHAIIDAMEAAVDRIERASPLSEDQISALGAAVIAAAADGGQAGARKGLARYTRSIDWRSAGLVGIAVAITGFGAAAMGWTARGQVPVPVAGIVTDRGAAEAWELLIRANPDVRPALSSSQEWLDIPSQRRSGMVPLYLEPPRPQVPARR